MPRRTPPVDRQVIDPFYPSNALLKKRLIDFDTGSSKLEVQHEAWLREAMRIASPNSSFHIHLYGFASQLGDVEANRKLSLDRMNSVLSFMQRLDKRSLSSVSAWQRYGEDRSPGPANDDSPEWRAVEVHIFIGEAPIVDPPPEVTEVTTKVVPPLPGGERFSNWSVASPGGMVVAVPVGVGVNIFFIRLEPRGDLRAYIQPVGAFGAGLGATNIRLFWQLIQSILTGIQLSSLEFKPVTTPVPVTWEEMETSLVRVSSGGAGLIRGVGMTVITFENEVWFRGESGQPLRDAVQLFQFTTYGKNWQLGAGATIAVGKLVRFDS
jgi:hypothetical protein